MKAKISLVQQNPELDDVQTNLTQNQIRRTRIRLPLLRDERQSLTLREMERIVEDQQ